MKKIFSPLFTFIIILFPIVSTAQNSTEISKTETIDRIFKEIPIEERLGDAPEMLLGLLSQNPFGLPSSQNEKMAGLFSEVFATDSLLHYAKKEFYRHYEAEAAKAVLDWFKMGNTQNVLDAERDSYTIQGIRKRVVNKYELEQNPPSEDRIELIKSLSQQMSAVETAVTSRAIIFRSLVTAFSELSNQQSLSEDQIEGTVNNYRYQVQPQVDQEVINQLLTVFHGLENEKLRKQTGFYETEAGKWLSSSISKSMYSAYRTASNQFLDSLQNL